MKIKKHFFLLHNIWIKDILSIGRVLTYRLIKIIGSPGIYSLLCSVVFFKYITASMLLAFYMLSATAIHEVVKLPMLVEHYFDHCREDQQIGLFKYLTLHYGIEDGTDKDAAEDRQLPFQSSEYFSSNSFVSVNPPVINQSIRIVESFSDNDFPLRNEAFLPSPYPDRIWQPPRQS